MPLTHAIFIDIIDRLWVSSCICGVELCRTHIAPVHVFGIWQRHLEAEGETKHHSTVRPVGDR